MPQGTTPDDAPEDSTEPAAETETSAESETGREGRELAGGEWYRSPFVLAAALLLFGGALGLIVLAITGPDEVPAITETVSFGGEAIGESGAVTINGQPLISHRPADVADSGIDDAVGTLSPDLVANSLGSGRPVSLAAGSARVLVFLSHWCDGCNADLRAVNARLADRPLPPNTEVVVVSTLLDEGEANFPPSDWFSRERFRAPVLVDDETATLLAAFGFTEVPAAVAIDASGVVVARHSGPIGAEGLAEMLALFAS